MNDENNLKEPFQNMMQAVDAYADKLADDCGIEADSPLRKCVVYTRKGAQVAGGGDSIQVLAEDFTCGVPGADREDNFAIAIALIDGELVVSYNGFSDTERVCGAVETALAHAFDALANDERVEDSP